MASTSIAVVTVIATATATRCIAVIGFRVASFITLVDGRRIVSIEVILDDMWGH